MTILEAGRDLDALVAEKVMGAEWKPNGAFAGHEWLMLESLAVAERGHGFDRQWDALRHYSTDIAAAWLVVARLNELGWLVVVKQMPEGVPYMIDAEGGKVHSRVVVSLQWVQWMKDASADAFKIGPTTVGDTVPDAVCRAALAINQSPPHVPDGRPCDEKNE